MRFNANREGRLAFGDLVEDYDLGRRRLDAAFVREVRHRLEESSGDESGGRRSPARQVLEVGAGTGQLTVGLLDSGDVVTAVEQDDLAAGVRRAAVFYGQIARMAQAEVAALREGILARLGRLEQIELSWPRYVVSARFNGGGR